MNGPMTLPEAQAFVEHRYGSRSGPLTFLGAGEWSRAYAFVLDGAERVIRFGNYPEDFAKDREMGTHSRKDLPIPPVIEIGDAPRGSFAISERATGEPLDDLDEAAMRSVLPALLRTLDAIRELPAETGDGYGLWQPGGAAPHLTWRAALLDCADENPRLPGWRAALEASSAGASSFDAGYQLLARLADRLPAGRHVIHGDLLNRNVLIREGEITAVLDWGNALFGDSLYDAAWLIYWWPWYPRWASIDITTELERHWANTVGLPPDHALRLFACQLHIAITAQAYNAFTGRWDELERNATRTAELLASFH